MSQASGEVPFPVVGVEFSQPRSVSSRKRNPATTISTVTSSPRYHKLQFPPSMYLGHHSGIVGDREKTRGAGLRLLYQTQRAR